jgi:hypothetical protein
MTIAALRMTALQSAIDSNMGITEVVSAIPIAC